MVEIFNGRLRQEFLNQHWFQTLADARSKIEASRKFCSEEGSQCTRRKALKNSPESTGPSYLTGAKKGQVSAD